MEMGLGNFLFGDECGIAVVPATGPSLLVTSQSSRPMQDVRCCCLPTECIQGLVAETVEYDHINSQL
jgi:hypothetical protein